MSFKSCQSLLLAATFDAENPSHSLLVDDQPCYRFTSEAVERDFYSSYVKVLQESRRAGVPCCIGEFPGDFVPIVYSFRGIIPYSAETEDLPSDFLTQVAECLTYLTRKLGNFDSQSLFENSQLTAIVTGRTRDRGDTYVYDLTFHYPLAVEAREKIERELYPEVVRYLSSKKFDHDPDFDEFQSDYYTKPVPMFGSSADEDGAEDYLGYIAISTEPKVEMTQDPQALFPICETPLYKRGIITREEVNYWNDVELDVELNMVKWLHVILSVRGAYQASSLKPRDETASSNFVSFSFKEILRQKEKRNSEYKAREVDLPVSELSFFVRGWHPFRIDHECEWKAIGEALFNFFEGDMKGLILWENLTNEIVLRRREVLRKLGLNDEGKLLNPIPGMDPKEESELLNRIYDDEAFKINNYLDITERDREKKTPKTAVPIFISKEGKSIYRKYYYSFKPGRLTYISLAEVCSLDSSVDFNAWHSNWIKEAVVDARCGMDTAIAISLYRFLFMRYFCCVTSKKGITFYQKKANRIAIDKSQLGLKKHIVTEFRDFYTKMVFDLQTQKRGIASTETAEINEVIAKTEIVIAKLDSQAFKDRLVKEVAIFLNKEYAPRYLDENRELTCTNNGVLVAGTKGIVFRRGRLEDYITKRFGTFYMDNMTADDPAVVRLMTWSKETFVANQPLIRWWWKYLASTFRGGNDDKIFPFLLGRKGNEGKSAWTNFLEMLLGDYCSNVEITYFTHTPKDANSATPITAMIHSCHLVITEEAEDTKPIRSGPFKKKTGKDKASKRELFGDAEVVELQCKFLGVGNKEPTFTRCGTAEEERFQIVPIVSQRVREAENLTEEEQYKKKMFKRDNFFDQNLQYYLNAGIWILVRYYSYYIQETLFPYPEKMVKATKQYWLDNDKFRRFEEAYVERYESGSDREGAVTKDDYVDVKTIYDLFKEWHEDEYPKDKIPNIDAVRMELRDRWGKIIKDRFYGIRLRKDKGKKKVPAIGGRHEREHKVESY